MKLPESILQRITKNSEIHTDLGKRLAYNAGATKEALLAWPLVEALQKVRCLTHEDASPEGYFFYKHIEDCHCTVVAAYLGETK